MTYRVAALTAAPRRVALGTARLGLLIALGILPPATLASSAPLPQGATTTAADSSVAGLLPLPAPDLSRVDPPLVEQIRSLEELIRRRSASASPAELAGAFATLGHLYTYYEMPEPALACYQNAVRLQPEDPSWHYYLGFVAADLGRVEEAVERFEEVLEREPGDRAALVRLGNLELDRDRPDTAERYFRRALEVDRELAAGWYGLGRVAVRQGDDAGAVERFRKTLELQPEADLVYYALGQSLRRLGRIDEAREALARRGNHKVQLPDPRVERLSDTSAVSSLELVSSLAADRKDFPDLRFLSYALSQLGAVAGAVERIERTLADWPAERRDQDRVQRARLYYALGGLLVNRDQPGKAEVHLRTALDLLPELTDARVKLANLLARDRRFEEAVAELTRVLESEPGDAAARLKRAAASMGMGRWQPAADDLLMLERTDPTHFEVQGRLAATLERLGRPQEAIVHYQAAARLEPSTERAAAAHVQAATLLLQTGDPDRALPDLEQAVALDPSLLDARVTLAGLLVRAQRPEEALRHFEGVIEHHPDALPAHLGRATVLLLLGRYAQARSALEDSLATLPGQPAVALLLARVLTAAPDDAVHDGARAEELAQRLDQAHPTPRSAELRALAAAERGRFDQAVDWLETAVERARQAGQGRLADYFAQRLPLYQAGRTWHARGPAELIVLPNEG